MIRIGHPYRDRAPDSPPPSDEPGPNPFKFTRTEDLLARCQSGMRALSRHRQIALDVPGAEDAARHIEKVREATRLGADARAHRKP